MERGGGNQLGQHITNKLKGDTLKSGKFQFLCLFVRGHFRGLDASHENWENMVNAGNKVICSTYVHIYIVKCAVEIYNHLIKKQKSLLSFSM